MRHSLRRSVPVVLVGLGLALAAGTSTAASSPPCTPKLTTIGGHRAAVNCGPATATLRVKGRTYSFRNGFCQQTKGSKDLILSLGTTVLGVHGNAGKPDMQITLIAPTGGTLGNGSVSGADYGGKELVVDELIKTKGAIAKGTFASTTASPSFTGSWNCHGVIWKQ